MILGVGCDIVKIARMNDKLATRILSEAEKERYETYEGQTAIEYLAGRFAAKEAIFKALPENDVTISQIEILSDEQGKPICSFKEYIIHVSISHEKEYAIAYAIVEK